MANYADRDPNVHKFTPSELNALAKDFFDPSERLAKIMIYGEPGSTKTTEAFRVGEYRLGLIADPNGHESLYNHPELATDLATGRIKLMNYKGFSQLEAIAQAFMEGHKDFKHFDTIVIDTASNMVYLDLDLITKVQIEKKSKLEESKRFDFENHMRGVYNQDAFRARVAFLKLFLAPVNVIATAHVRYYRAKDNPDTIVKVAPRFPPEVLAAISGFTTMVGYMKADAKINEQKAVRYARYLQVHPTHNVEAKTRIGGLPLVIPNPDLRQIIADWKAKGGVLVEPELNDPAEGVTSDELESFGMEQ